MKFSKELRHAALPEWRLYFINYKRLKRTIKDVCTHTHTHTHTDTHTQTHTRAEEDASACAAFWSAFDSECAKVRSFYNQKIAWARQQERDLSAALTDVEVCSPFTPNARRCTRARTRTSMSSQTSSHTDVHTHARSRSGSASPTRSDGEGSVSVFDGASEAAAPVLPRAAAGVARDLFGAARVLAREGVEAVHTAVRDQQAARPSSSKSSAVSDSRSGASESGGAAAVSHCASDADALETAHADALHTESLPRLRWIEGTAGKCTDASSPSRASTGQNPTWSASRSGRVSPLELVAAACETDLSATEPRASAHLYRPVPHLSSAVASRTHFGRQRTLVAPHVYASDCAAGDAPSHRSNTGEPAAIDNDGASVQSTSDGETDASSPPETAIDMLALPSDADVDDNVSDADTLDDLIAECSPSVGAAPPSGAATVRGDHAQVCTENHRSTPGTMTPRQRAARPPSNPGDAEHTERSAAASTHTSSAISTPKRLAHPSLDIDVSALQLSPLHMPRAAAAGRPASRATVACHPPLTIATVTRRVTSQQMRFLRSRKAVSDLQHELDLLMQYLRLNDRAVYKIVKKWDKRTGNTELRDGFLDRFHASEYAFMLGDELAEVMASVRALAARVRAIEPRAKAWKRTKAFTIGCFDVFHHGHSNLLTALRQFGRHVIVGIHDDESYKLLKGALPMDPLEQRIAKVKPYVHQIFVIESTDPTPYIKAAVSPADVASRSCVYVRGDDMPNFPAREWVESVMDVYLLPRTGSVSSSFIKMVSEPGVDLDSALEIAFAPTDYEGKPVLSKALAPTGVPGSELCGAGAAPASTRAMSVAELAVEIEAAQQRA